MPHGGFKHSGYGKDLSMYGLEDYTRIKHVMSYIERVTGEVAEPDLRAARLGEVARAAAARRSTAIDRYWKPVWETLPTSWRCSRAPARERPRRRRSELEFEAVEELEPGAKWQSRFEAMWPGLPGVVPAARAMPRARPTWPAGAALARAHARARAHVRAAGRARRRRRPRRAAALASTGRRASSSAARRAPGRASEPVLVRNYDYPAAGSRGSST